MQVALLQGPVVRFGPWGAAWCGEGSDFSSLGGVGLLPFTDGEIKVQRGKMTLLQSCRKLVAELRLEPWRSLLCCFSSP